MAVSAVTAASASAAEWYVGGKALSGSASLAKTVKVEEPIVFTAKTEKITGETLKVACTSVEWEGGTITAPSATKVSGVELSGCKMTGLKNCSMGNELGFEPFEGSLASGTAPEDSVEFKQKGYELALFTLSGGSCFFVGEDNYLVGKFTMKAVKGQEEKAEQEFVGEGEASKGLELVGWGEPHPPVYLTGRFKLKLTSGANWSFH